jgi:hypothetical protein
MQTSLQLSPVQAALELQRRREARRSLVGFARYIDVPGAPTGKLKDWRTADDDADDEQAGYKPAETELAAHHQLILNACQRCVETPYGRLMLFMPPGSAKSTYGSVVVPSYYRVRCLASR